MILLAESEDPDQTVWMPGLIWAFAVRIFAVFAVHTNFWQIEALLINNHLH